MLIGVGAPRWSSPIDQAAVTVAVTVAVPPKAEAVAVLVQSAVSVVATVVNTAHVLTGLAPEVLSLSATPVFIDVNFSVFKVFPLPGMRSFVVYLLVLRDVLLSKFAIHPREPLARHFNLTDWPDSGQEVPSTC